MVGTMLKIVRVFIGSPGGLEAERQAAKRVVEEINQNHSEHWGCQINLVGWEATLPGYSRAQSLINQDLDKCDYFIGILWDHWGSKPDDGECEFTSGFHEGFERATERYNDRLMRDIALFFKDIPTKQWKDPGASLKQVIAFREKCIKERKPLFKEFKEIGDFERLFRAKIEAIGWQEFENIGARAREITDPEQPDAIASNLSKIFADEPRLLGNSSSKFIGQLLDRPNNWEAISAFEVARLRLMATNLKRTGNDLIYLGNHDANLLFIEREEFEFDEQECLALADVGIAGFHHQNVPLWTWLHAASTSGDPFWRPRVLSIFGDGQQKVNSIKILQRAGEKTPFFGENFTRETTLRGWLLTKNGDGLSSAALSFLNTNGELADANIIENFINDIPEAYKGSVVNTLISLLAATHISQAFKRLFELNPDDLGSGTADALFVSPDSIPTSTAQQLLILKSNRIRRAAAALLNARRALDVKTAEALMTDADMEVRLFAVDALLQQGVPLQEETIKKTLICARPNALLSGLGSAAPDESIYEKYRRNRLVKLRFGELRTIAESCDILDHLEFSVLCEKHTGRYLTEMRSALDNGFKSFFDIKLARFALLCGNDDQVSKVKKLEDWIRMGFVSRTLSALCAHSDRCDLSLIRKTLNQWDVEFSPAILHFLGRFGDWTDLDRVLAFVSRHKSRIGIFSTTPDENAKAVAEALYMISKTRLIDLLDIDVDFVVRRLIMRKLTKSDIRSLSDDVMIIQLNNADDQSRKIFALKCSLHLSQTRVQNLLRRYIRVGTNQKYYNSIHWMDFGASMEKGVAKAIIKYEIEKAST